MKTAPLAYDGDLIRRLWKEGLYRKLANYLVTTWQHNRGHSFVLGYPYHIFVDPSSRCTLRCPFCAVGTKNYPKPHKDMPLEAFEALMRELGPYILVAELFVKGEPLMNEAIYDMIACCRRHRVWTRVSSNMQFVDPERLVRSGLNHLLASIDGVSQQAYEGYRKGGKAEAALRHLRQVVETKRRLGSPTPIVEWKYIVFRHNEHELKQAERLAADIGVDALCFVPALVGDPPLTPEQEAWLPLDKKYRMYGEAGAALEKTVGSRAIEETCNLPWTSLTVDPLSNVQTCCRCNESKHDHGRVGPGFFWRVWNGPRYRRSRRFVTEPAPAEADPTNLCAGCAAKSSLNTVLPFEFHKAL